MSRLDSHADVRRNPTGDRRELVAEGLDQFRFTTSTTRVRFQRDSAARVTSMHIKTAYDREHDGRRVP